MQVEDPLTALDATQARLREAVAALEGEAACPVDAESEAALEPDPEPPQQESAQPAPEPESGG